ncbi:hypothetical protein MM239_14980 [Belliella sp. DSM 111904]|uniref:Uncharacterized protein n=1 Tax=Belliella filtrata TaxID=2923435 RepID=A0ABS9V3Z9_9BACT|nr:hypothetical protein [Belliella filtrata]MCH7410710.1 hypothetical protein [Belliella filtrata]
MKRSILQNGLYTLFILLVIIGFIFPMQAFGQAGTLNLTEVGFHGNTLTDGDACSINIPGITYNIYGVNSSGGKIGNILVLDYSPPRESHYFFVDDGSYFGLPINRLIIESGSGNSLSEHLPTILVGSIYPW